LSAGSGAGDGEDGRPAGPACPSGGWAPPGQALTGAKPGRTEGEEPEYDLAEELPTMPPPSAGAEPALRWAEVGPLPDPGKGPEGLLYEPPRGPLPRPAGRQPSGAAVANPPPGSVPSRVGERYVPRPLGPPPPPRATAIGGGANAPTLPFPAAQTGPGRGRDGTAPLRPTAAITTPERSPRRGRAIFWLVALVVIVAASVSAAIVLAGREAIDHRHSLGTSTGEALFEQLMASNSNAEELVATAVARSCAQAAPGIPLRSGLLGDLSRAISLRQSVLRALAADRVQLLAMADGAQRVSDLSAATTANLTLDQDYQAWLQDLQATGCYSAPTNDIHYRTAGLDSSAAAGADERLAQAWTVSGPASPPHS
jgi:hypothetical protein